MAEFFIRRPIVAMVISILIVLVGTVALLRLPVEQYPELAPPNIQVQAFYPGASAEVVEQSVATPIEQQVNGVDHMIYMRSVNSSDGRMSLNVTFEVGVSGADRVLLDAGKLVVNPGGAIITITPLAGFGTGTYDLVSFDSGQASGLEHLSLFSTTLNGFSLSLQPTPTAVVLVVTPVPEPAGIGLVALGAFGLNRLYHRRRRCRGWWCGVRLRRGFCGRYRCRRLGKIVTCAPRNAPDEDHGCNGQECELLGGEPALLRRQGLTRGF